MSRTSSGAGPTVRDAFATGELSWCQARAITRIEGADEETDRTLMEAARQHSVAALERLVRHWKLLADQERGVEGYLARYDRRNLRASRTFDGMMVVEVGADRRRRGAARSSARRGRPPCGQRFT